MSWYLPVPQYADEATGTTWRVSRAWFDKKPGNYVLEVVSQGRTRALRGAYLRQGRFELVPLDDPELPALRAEAQEGELINRPTGVRWSGRRAETLRFSGQGRPSRPPNAAHAWTFSWVPAAPSRPPQDPSQLRGRHRFQHRPGTDPERAE